LTINDRSRLDDHWSRKARQEGYPARSVWKLEELDRKHGLLKPGLKVLDLGCAPGGWTLFAAKAVGPAGLVVGIDLSPPLPGAFPSNVELIAADLLLSEPALAAGPGPYDLVLSDLAPKTTGRREVDQARSLELCERAWDWARALMRPGGAFLFKLFESPSGDALARGLSSRFARQVRLKPKATRSASVEIFVLGLGFKKEPREGAERPGGERQGKAERPAERQGEAEDRAALAVKK
jgi:23S rRNA (uridine2552-2'-O)-methyltransferase